MKTLLALALFVSLLSPSFATSPIMPDSDMDYESFNLYDTKGGLDDIEGCYTFSRLVVGSAGFLGNIAKMSSNHQSVKGLYACPAIFKIPVVNLFSLRREYSVTNDYCTPITYKGRLINSSLNNYSSTIEITDYREVRCRMAVPAQVVVKVTTGTQVKVSYYNSYWK
jgi:hypothetical protein